MPATFSIEPIIEPMPYSLVLTFSCSVAIGAVIGLIRIRKVESTWLPFIICLCLATVNEAISWWQVAHRRNTAPNNNVYVLAEALLFTWQFSNWQVFGRKIFGLIVAGLLMVWLIDNHSAAALEGVEGWFRITASFVIVTGSITYLNALIFSYNRRMITSPAFLVTAGAIIFFTYKILIEAFWKYGILSAPGFAPQLYLVMVWINLFVNLLYAAAVICIPKKKYYLGLS